jgi:hypothetical protein
MPTLNSITFDLTEWNTVRKDDAMAVWSDDDGDFLAVNLFHVTPDIPPPSDGVQHLRDYFRQQCAAPDSGIVEVEVVSICGIPCGRLVVKSRMRPTGFTFQGTCVIPKRDFSFVIRVQCLERGTTGAREASVMLVELPNPEYEPDPDQKQHSLFRSAKPLGRMKGWFKDPYDSSFDAGALRTLADDDKYDSKFPTHPLSRARRKIDSVIATIKFGKDVLATPNHAR